MLYPLACRGLRLGVGLVVALPVDPEIAPDVFWRSRLLQRGGFSPELTCLPWRRVELERPSPVFVRATCRPANCASHDEAKVKGRRPPSRGRVRPTTNLDHPAHIFIFKRVIRHISEERKTSDDRPDQGYPGQTGRQAGSCGRTGSAGHAHQKCPCFPRGLVHIGGVSSLPGRCARVCATETYWPSRIGGPCASGSWTPSAATGGSRSRPLRAVTSPRRQHQRTTSCVERREARGAMPQEAAPRISSM
ncbi:uncharacterized protein PFL1_02887 [Pseudozyma flocculosa PF-1]|uniref:Secreted protein n=1 Tax=Pseudozyma flocculosa PF-1 TaxID=1277687 RepID=A0A061H9V0_9BASI|nr:uncharacterized protein PFL1_02887 [Pseudozyma flocculosa PF-1]EPQ29667.1 hypothetical protein PFL1_02887 [Pseudozyma flocculosa PF-1]